VKEKLYFVGPGRAGLALGQALYDAGAVGDLLYCGRRPAPPTHPLFDLAIARYCFGLEPPAVDTTAVFLSVPDDDIPEMAHALAGHGSAPPGCAAFHLSGALNTDVLSPLHARGYAVGSFHMLQSLADPATAARKIPGSFVSVAGEPTAVATGRRLAQHLGSRMLAVPVTRRPLYHAAAVLASSHISSLLALAARLMERAGIPEEDALPALLPLVRGNLDNIEALGVTAALTGPVARGDVETVGLHLRSLDGREREVYRLLTLELLERVAVGLDRETQEELAGLLQSREGGGR
jgi:predicted short-subunit dehydrogenase-like oxidoreductase (DUF2520 family)